MKALVTGGAGFIGSSIARALLARGDEVVVLDNFLTGFEEAVPEGATLIRGDLRNPEDCAKACEGVEVVFHQGAIRSVERSVDDPTLVSDCNVMGSVNLLVAAEAAGARRVVYASSSSVYGDVGATIEHEEMLPQPLSPYAVSKLSAEYYCRAWTQLKGLSTISLRYFNVYGPGQHRESKYAAVFPAFVGALVNGEAPELHWDGEQTRDFSYIDDVVSANLASADAGPEADGVVLNIGGGEPKSVNQVLQAVSEAVGVWIEPTRTDRRPGDVRHTHADISKAMKYLDWEPKATWKESVEATVAWFQK